MVFGRAGRQGRPNEGQLLHVFCRDREIRFIKLHTKQKRGHGFFLVLCEGTHLQGGGG